MMRSVFQNLSDLRHFLNWAHGDDIPSHDIGGNDIFASIWHTLNNDWQLFGTAGPLIEAASQESPNLVSHQDGEGQWHEQVEAVGRLQQDDCD